MQCLTPGSAAWQRDSRPGITKVQAKEWCTCLEHGLVQSDHVSAILAFILHDNTNSTCCSILQQPQLVATPPYCVNIESSGNQYAEVSVPLPFPLHAACAQCITMWILLSTIVHH